MSLAHALSHHTLRPVRLLRALLLAMVVVTVGCGSPKEGSLDDARAHLTAELDKWVGGRPSDAETMEGRLHGASPSSYSIENIVPGDLPILVSTKEVDTPMDVLRGYPSYRANVTLSFKSQSGTPTSRAVAYSLTWSEKAKVWYIIDQP